ncbi:MAG: DUF4386 domain-containing protein [Xanthomonadaceae bacterium]|nr:DUF4386 domain-containing protein [Xanthomonadaceae bacterium]
MRSLDKTARIAGFLYLLVVITGLFTLMYAPGKLFVPGDATTVASNILAHQSLFRADIVVGLLSELFFIATVLMLYRLLKETGPQLAAVMVLLVLLDAPLAFAGTANQVATLTFLRGADFLAAFDQPQRYALAMLFIHLDAQATTVSEIFWGLWLLPLGWLVYRSGFLPRLLGIWLTINGLAYMLLSATELLMPEHLKMVSTMTAPILLGEVAFTLWLLIVGARVKAAPATAA